MIIESDVHSLRDPFVLVENGTYYMYGTGWVCYKNDSGRLDEGWIPLGQVAAHPDDYLGDPWAPEVHKYKGKFYMFTTYLSDKTNCRGCTILRADSPEGPFMEISDGPLTDKDNHCIDGTLYIDQNDQPWMVYVDEWIGNADKIGTMAAAKLSDDLTHFISEPIHLFSANEAPWSRDGVTDGPFLYRTTDGELLMLWSNFDIYGYCVGIAKSDNRQIDGKWIQFEENLYTKSENNLYDGGHGMIFTALDGKKYLSIHSPNTPVGDRGCKPVFIPVKEKDGILTLEK